MNETDPSTGQSPAMPGRPYALGLSLVCMAVLLVAGIAGLLLAPPNLMGYHFGAWASESPLTPAATGALMLGAVPGLVAMARQSLWEHVRCLVLPLLIVVVGLLGVSVLNWDRLYVQAGGAILPFLFSVLWLVVLAAMATLLLVMLFVQLAKPAGAALPKHQPLPDWTKPLVAILGSGWFGLGVALLGAPEFWGAFVPWAINILDAQCLGVLSAAIGVGILGALAEDDLLRLRAAMLAATGAAIALMAVLAVLHGQVAWAGWPGLALVALVGGLLLCGVIGAWLSGRQSD